ncbi:hypothetical protein BaRGS_00030059 [Batillaria attramentaria]|uniref:Uncharacterized protein n=1 Tax=Batillaria attramentaria TaxID=370345 RepID=A0ABD0JVE3_9CAEN
MDMEGKGVFLTGGGRGVGRAMVEALLDKGARVGSFYSTASLTHSARLAETLPHSVRVLSAKIQLVCH